MKTLIAVIATLSLMFGATAQADDNLSQAELNQLLAPVALYPDTVLSHLLIASTYPLEVVQAERWTRQNPNLEGEAAVDAVEHQDWDPSVKALVAFPHLLERMAEDLDWTQTLGEAFLYDEAAVLSTVQDLRQRAYEAGSLKTTEYQEVVRERKTIIIEPRVSEVVYIPYYDTRVVYGPWHWHSYPPVVWHRPSRGYWHAGIFWSHGARISTHFYFSSFHWHNRHTVVIDLHHGHHRPRFHSGRSVVRYHNAKRWRHNPTHRRGVEYHQTSVRKQYASPARSLRASHPHRDRRAQGIEHRLKDRSGARAQPRHRPARSAEAPAKRKLQRAQKREQTSRLEQRSPPERRDRARSGDRRKGLATMKHHLNEEAQGPRQRGARSDRTHPRGAKARAQRSPNNFGNQSFQRSNRERLNQSRGRSTSDRAGRHRTTRDR